jgi:hypothetical protein
MRYFTQGLAEEDPAASAPVDGGDGLATVELDTDDKRVLAVLGARTRSNPERRIR